jgi:hypothetical protein
LSIFHWRTEGKRVPYLLAAAIGKTQFVCENIGCRYLLVDSKKDSIGFYQKNGFKLVEKYRNREFIPIYLNLGPIVDIIESTDFDLSDS